MIKFKSLIKDNEFEKLCKELDWEDAKNSIKLNINIEKKS
jgi:hypothetical protein